MRLSAYERHIGLRNFIGSGVTRSLVFNLQNVYTRRISKERSSVVESQTVLKMGFQCPFEKLLDLFDSSETRKQEFITLYLTVKFYKIIILDGLKIIFNKRDSRFFPHFLINIRFIGRLGTDYVFSKGSFEVKY